jgi:hypothetical protein
VNGGGEPQGVPFFPELSLRFFLAPGFAWRIELTPVYLTHLSWWLILGLRIVCLQWVKTAGERKDLGVISENGSKRRCL